MKSYKLVNSKEMELKAQRLGKLNKESFKKGTDILFICSRTNEYFTRELKSYNEAHQDFKEITQKDFLELPEPFKVGDWVKFESNGRIVVFKIAIINNENEAFWLKTDDRYFNLDYCTKLTKEQLKIMGLI